ncbi:MAG: LamG-like jellyroll fold domain-containing protein, partial [bacterium]
DMWIDSTVNLTFDSEEVLSRASNFIYPWVDARNFTNGTFGPALANTYYRNWDGVPGYQQSGDEAWVSPLASPVFGGEIIIAGNRLTAGDTNTYVVANAYYNDFNISGGFNVSTDPVWMDVFPALDGIYAANANIQIPVYLCALQNLGAAASEGSVPAGDWFDVFHRDGDAALGGFMHIVGPTEMALLTHEQGHDIQGWPDLYDYDRFDPHGYFNIPVGGFDLMSGGGFVHGLPDLKGNAYNGSWIDPVDLTTILPINGGARTLRMYPIERHRNQYFFIDNPANPGEKFWFWYQAGDQPNAYQSFASIGAQGLHIQHEDIPGRPTALPPQQRLNNHYTWQMVQADGLYQMDDGLNMGNHDDVWPGTTDNRAFTADTIPTARWWDQSDIGIRIMDVRLPATPADPMEIDIEYYSIAQPWLYPSLSDDIDGDGIPDAWEYHYFGALDVVDATTDWDHDGLSDLGEYLSRTDPKSHEGLSVDAYSDADADGLSNWEEVNIFGTMPFVSDADDDGVDDGIEVDPLLAKVNGRRLTDPLDSRSPLVQRSMLLTNVAVTVPGIQEGTSTDRFDLATWTIECWVKRPASPDSGNLISRITERGQTNFCLRITNGMPVVEFTTETGHRYFAGSNVAIPIDEWTHVAGVWDPANDTLQLYVNGLEFQAQISLAECAQGFGDTTIGVFDGAYVDEVRIWGAARSLGEITGGMYNFGEGLGPPADVNVVFESQQLIAYYPFDDGGVTAEDFV